MSKKQQLSPFGGKRNTCITQRQRDQQEETRSTLPWGSLAPFFLPRNGTAVALCATAGGTGHVTAEAVPHGSSRTSETGYRSFDPRIQTWPVSYYILQYILNLACLDPFGRSNNDVVCFSSFIWPNKMVKYLPRNILCKALRQHFRSSLQPPSAKGHQASNCIIVIKFGIYTRNKYIVLLSVAAAQQDPIPKNSRKMVPR